MVSNFGNAVFSFLSAPSACYDHIFKAEPLIAVGAEPLLGSIGIDSLQIIFTCSVEIVGTGTAQAYAHCFGFRFDQADTDCQGMIHTAQMGLIQCAHMLAQALLVQCPQLLRQNNGR